MRSRALLSAVCCALLVAGACSSSHTKVLGTTKTKAPHSASRSTNAPISLPGVPKVILQSGTSYQNGALVQFCTGSSCRQGAATQKRPLDTHDPLLFIVDSVPETAQVQLTRAGATAPSATGILHIGSLMAYAPTVRPGTYVVQLDATWAHNARGSWIFSVLIQQS
ncbi:MAG TPA: hypothetical protein VJ818_06020 [Actinomycetota bacterium]|nr:hypothetical protein [Actinomycetota bacterium]